MAKKSKKSYDWAAYYRKHKKEYATWGKAYRAKKRKGRKTSRRRHKK